MNMPTWQGLLSELVSFIFPRHTPLVQNARKEDIRDAINVARKRYGLEPLRLCSELTTAAQQSATELSQAEQYSLGTGDRIVHIFPKVSDLPRGHLTTADTVQIWIHCQPQRSLVLGKHLCLGVGRAKSARGEQYWILDFKST